jgi:hypothetical protein
MKNKGGPIMFSKAFLFPAAAAFLVLWFTAIISAEEYRGDHVTVSYEKIGKDYAEALGRTLSAARRAAAAQFAFDMPETIHLEVTVDPQAKVNLFNDGQDRIFLTIRSEEDLRKPASSGIFHIYGLCHEVGHLAMYRLIRDHSWMQGTAAESWAHYLGSRLVDAVHAQEGDNLWPDRYPYLDDGMKRLKRQLASPKPSAFVKAAGVWKQLAETVGDKNIAPLFRAWGKAKPDSADPAKELGKVLLATSGEKAQSWWHHAQAILLLKRPRSSYAAQETPGGKDTGFSQELARDDGKSAGSNSIAGGGHAVRFEAPGDSYAVTEVRVYGSRYGYPAPPPENFHVWICDEDFKMISDHPFPYSKFPYGQNPRWVSLRIKAQRVPQDFIICVGFNPTGTKGVYVHYDGEGSGYSLTGLPGQPPRDFVKGDWMIRVKVRKAGGS